MAEPNFTNRTLYIADNMDILPRMPDESVHLIATDPPFNKGQDWRGVGELGYDDRWTWADVREQDRWGVFRSRPDIWQLIDAARLCYGDDMGAFLCWLGVRLIEMRRVLRDDGSIYLHIDHTAHAWTKALMDAIFGRQNFRNEIVWHYSKGHSPKMDFRRKHDTILRYTKTAQAIFNRPSYPHLADPHNEFKYYDDDGRRYRLNRTNDKDGNPKRFYWDDGIPVDTVWTYLRDKDFNQLNSNAPERTGYPTQKPLALYERIIKASSNPGDIVLDPFCGCATTLVAAERLGRQWVGIDANSKAAGIIERRLWDNRQMLGAAPVGPVTVLNSLPPLPPRRTDAPKRINFRAEHIGRLIAEIGWICQGCGRDYSDDRRTMQVDHIIASSQGGDDGYDNATLLCGPCNNAKGALLTIDALRRQNAADGELRNFERFVKPPMQTLDKPV